MSRYIFLTISLSGLLCSVLMLCGCERSPIEEAEMRIEIDTLAKKEIRKIDSQLDSICSENSAKWEQRYVDSIFKIRKRQILGKLRSVND